MPPGSVSYRYRIADLVVEVGRRAVLRGTSEIHLPKLSFELLRTLIDAAPNVVSNEQLARAVWQGVVVSPETVTQRVKVLRDSLGDDHLAPRYIAGLRGQGYRLIPKVVVEPEGDHAARGSAVAGRRSPLVGILLAATALAVAGTITAVIGIRQHVSSPQLRSEEPSIAILPFANLSAAQDDAYLADGLTEELISRLSAQPNLRVPASTSSFYFKGRQTTIPEIAQTLHVAHLVEGSVRRSGEHLRITVQLVRGADGAHVWSRTYDRPAGDLLVVEDDVAAAVVQAMRLTFSEVRPWHAPRIPEAYDLWLRSVYQRRLGTRASLDEAQGLLEKAVTLDPQFADAWTDLANVYAHRAAGVWASTNRDAFGVKARAAAERAVALAPTRAGPHLVLVHVRERVDHDCSAAEAEARRAFELEPINPLVLDEIAKIEAFKGHRELAIRIAEDMVARDPLDPWAWYDLGWVYRMSERFEDAVRANRRFADIAPDSLLSGAAVALAELDASRPELALEVASHAAADPPVRDWVLAEIYDALGRRNDSNAALKRLQVAQVDLVDIVGIYVRRGDLNSGFEWLNRIDPTRENPVEIWALGVEPSLKLARADPRWPAFWDRMRRDLNIPE